jgi:hypothetical protein
MHPSERVRWPRLEISHAAPCLAPACQAIYGSHAITAHPGWHRSEFTPCGCHGSHPAAARKLPGAALQVSTLLTLTLLAAPCRRRRCCERCSGNRAALAHPARGLGRRRGRVPGPLPA